MNIFELYLDKIKSIIIELSKKNQLILPESFNGINAEIPPPQFDCDISTNVAMVLSKINKTSPIQLAEKLAPEIKNSDDQIESASVAKPGFINIKFKPSFWANFIKEIFSARSNGDFLFIFDSTIATLVEISQSNLAGGISALIPLNVSGIISSPCLFKSTIVDLILSK